MQFKVKKTLIISVFFILIFTKPTFVDVFPALAVLNYGYDICRVLLMIGIPIYYFIQKNHSVNIVIIIMLYTMLAVSTYLNHGELRSVVLAAGNVFACCMFAEIGMKKSSRAFLQAVKYVFFIYIFLNFFTLLFYPKGWFISGEVNKDNWFLGNKNVFVMFHIPYLFSTYALKEYEKNKFSVTDVGGIIITIICTLLSGSATGIMGIGVFFAIYYFRTALKKTISSKMGIVVCYALFVLIVIFNLARLFSFLIVTVLHRNLTLTVRTYVWEEAINWYKTSPLFGVGIQPSDIAKDHLFNYYHPHCTYLFYLVFSGVIGFAIYTLYLIYVSKKIDEHGSNISIPCVAVLWCILVTYITEVYSRPELFFMAFTIAVSMTEKVSINFHAIIKKKKKQRLLKISHI